MTSLLEKRKKKPHKISQADQLQDTSPTSDTQDESKAPAETTIAPVGSVWDCEHVERGKKPNSGDKFWKCLWCHKTFSQWNSTKAIYHLNQTKGCDIKPCLSDIDFDHKRHYTRLMEALQRKRRKHQSRNETNKDDAFHTVPISNKVETTTEAKSVAKHKQALKRKGMDIFTSFVDHIIEHHDKELAKEQDDSNNQKILLSDAKRRRLESVEKVFDENCHNYSEAPSSPLDKIWKDDYLVKQTGPDGKRFWTCLWCSETFDQNWDSFHAICHVNQLGGCGVEVSRTLQKL